MASKNPKPIHHQMVRTQWVEDEALRKAGLRDVDVNRDRGQVSWVDEDYPIGPCAENLKTLREKYGE